MNEFVRGVALDERGERVGLPDADGVVFRLLTRFLRSAPPIPSRCRHLRGRRGEQAVACAAHPGVTGCRACLTEHLRGHSREIDERCDVCARRDRGTRASSLRHRNILFIFGICPRCIARAARSD